MTDTKLFFAVLAFAACSVLIAYPSHALRRGLPMGQWFASGTAGVAGALTAAATFLYLAYLGEWVIALVLALLCLFIAGPLVLALFGSNAQLLAVIGAPIGLLALLLS